MSTIDRRVFLRTAAKFGGSAAVFAPSLAGLAACNDAGSSALLPGEVDRIVRRAARGFGGYGALAVSDTCPELKVAAGFHVVRLSRTATLSQSGNGLRVPQALDGMAAFAHPNGNVRLVRNHEIRDRAPTTPIGANPYDPTAGGGTTTLEVRIERDLEGGVQAVHVLEEFASLSGTHVNCAGGPTPWGSWLSCEETTEGAAQGRGREHGYVFEVRADANSPVDPVPLKAMGRFVHEAVAVDPLTGFVYETEDFRYNPANPEAQPGSGFYRFIPNENGKLSAGGRLQMLAVRGRPGYNTVTGQRPGAVLPVEWVDIDDADPVNAATDPSAVFRQGLAKGGAIFQRLEGCWYGDGSIFFNATSGGDAGAGQVWQYRPLGSREAQLRGTTGQLILVFESPGAEVLDSPDNICVSPRGGLVICEDGDGTQFLRGLTQRGEIFGFVETHEPAAAYGGAEPAEFAGACFSPDGSVLFFNIQGSTASDSQRFGATYAMWGPWEEGAL